MTPPKNKLPGHLDMPAAWFGPELSKRQEVWKWELSGPEIDELISAAQYFHATESSLDRISPANFPLKLLNQKLAALRRALIKGIGFEVISGFPVRQIENKTVQTVFCGIGSYLGRSRPQNAAGDLLGHVRDMGVRSNDANIRIYQTNERQTFHTDSADVVGLLCLNEARLGGESLLASAVTLFNEILHERPDLIPMLFDRIATDRRGEIPEGSLPFFTIPVFSWYRGFLTVMYQRQYIDSAQRFAAAPRLTSIHVEALDLFDSLANDPRNHLKMRLRPGDMQFVYNHSLLHDRTAFVDSEEPEKRRHLLRLWLSVPGDRPLPVWFEERYGSVEIGNRGGVNV